MSNPYEKQSSRAFWKTAVAQPGAAGISQLWQPKFPISSEDVVVTFGSCFAQHFSRALIARGYQWFNGETAPKFVPDEVAATYNYGVFSARTGNIYTPAALRQWLEWAAGKALPPSESWIDGAGRHYDPFRPNIEPSGFVSAPEMLASRLATLRGLRKAVEKASVFVFTLGLTEAWEHREHGHVYAMCPGTVAGKFDADVHVFSNHDYARNERELTQAIGLLRDINPDIKVLLTVSPVPLTGTATNEHVLTATTWSKSVLRAVAGAAAGSHEDADYFPSYEVITAPVFGGKFYASNMRSVRQEGVDFVMKSFFDCQGTAFGTAQATPSQSSERPQGPVIAVHSDPEAEADVVCEDEMLEAFAEPNRATSNT